MQAMANDTSVDLFVPTTITLTRVFAAPRELVWRAFTEPAMLAEWYGPNGFRTETEAFELRVGGEWRSVMIAPDGTRFPNNGTFLEVDPPSRLVREVFGKREGAATADHLVFITAFEDVDGGTLLTHSVECDSAEERDAKIRDYNAVEGGKQTLARLANFLGTQITTV
jgi:uncharacterized protein YndB with AHSA1/START domain